MRARLLRRTILALAISAGIAWVSIAHGQDVAWGKKCSTPNYFEMPNYCPSATEPPTATTTPPVTPPTPTPLTEPPATTPLAFGATDTGETFAAASSAVGYIDSAIPVTQYRLRTDAAWGDNVPDRADFFYPKCGCFPGAPGPVGAGNTSARNVNYQEISNYFEYAPSKRFSAFVDIPVRFVEIQFFPPGGTEDAGGLSDIDFGFKYAVLYSPDNVLTGQLRCYTPSGNPHIGLGRNNWNLEPALLYYHRVSERLFLEAELRDFIPVGVGDDFAGNVLRYGIGASYFVYNQPCFRIAPVVECVGWTVLSGQEFVNGMANINAAGDTIVNAKVGVRTYFGQPTGNQLMNRCDFYAGYGRALTGDVWYKDIMRFEFRMRF
jgi:hypothetical protein